MTRRLPALAVAALALFAGAAGPAAAEGPPLLAFVGPKLARLDPGTLRALPGRIPLAGHEEGWSFSSDGRLLALGRGNDSCVGGAVTLRLVDAGAMRSLGDVRLVAQGHVAATAWVGDSRLLALVRLSDCVKDAGTAVVSVDTARRKVVAWRRVPGDVTALARTGRGLVLLLAPRDRVGVARLAVVDRDARLRLRWLPGIRAGRTPFSGEHLISTVAVPGLAVDTASRRAFVAAAGGRIAEVDLATLALDLHVLARRSLSKGMDGPVREAVWLGGGILAVGGSDDADTSDGLASRPAGLRLVDTRSWTYRTLRREVSHVVAAGGVVLGADGWWGGHGSGLHAYARDGTPRYHLFGRMRVELVEVRGGRAYAQVGNRTVAFDAATGDHRRSFRRPLHPLLLGGAAAF